MEHQLINWLDGTFAWGLFKPNPVKRERKTGVIIRNDFRVCERGCLEFDLTTYEAAQLFGGGN